MKLEKRCPKCKSLMRLVAREPQTTTEPIVQFHCLNETCGWKEPVYNQRRDEA